MKKDLEKLNKLHSLAEDESKYNSPDKLSPRKRLEKLFDNGKYKELFKFAGSYEKGKNFKDGIICANGFIHGKPILAYACEYDVQGGSVGHLQAQQMVELYRLARQSGIPIIGLMESGGAKISDGIHIMERYAQVMTESVICSGVIPQIVGVFGYCIGASAFIATLNDFVVMSKNSTMAIAGASVNKAATGEDVTEEELGGIEVHSHSGAVHFVRESEEETIECIRNILEFLPQNNAENPPIIQCNDPDDREEEIVNEIIPEDTDTPFNIKKLIRLFTDNNSFFEVHKEFAPNVVTGFAQFGGITVGIAANQSMYMAGAFDCKAFKKMARFVNFLGNFNFPLITFVDVPGAIPTLEENKKGILLHGTQLLQAIGHLKTLKVSIVVRRCFGGAYVMMNPKVSGGDMIFAYPGAMIGVMSDKATSSVMKKSSKEMSEKIDLMHKMGQRFDDPFIAASHSYIDDVIYPSKTRFEIINALKIFYNKRYMVIPPKWLNNPPL